SLPHYPEDHDAVPAAGADIGERSACAVEGAERGWVAGVIGGVGRVEVVVLVHVVHIEAEIESNTLVNGPLLRERRLTPDDSGSLQRVAAERAGGVAGRVGESVDIEVALLRGCGEAVRSDIDVRELHFVVRF